MVDNGSNLSLSCQRVNGTGELTFAAEDPLHDAADPGRWCASCRTIPLPGGFAWEKAIADEVERIAEQLARKGFGPEWAATRWG